MKLQLPQPLSKQYQEEHERLTKIIKNFPWESKKAYAQFLGQSYYYARESTRILALASAYFDLNQNSMHYRFLDHAREEKGHEVLLIKDLRHLDMKIDDIKEMPELSAFYHNLYYWIEHKHPIALFGWVLNLEGCAIEDGSYIYKRVVAAHGEKSASFLKVHAFEDIEHIQSALKFMQELDETQIAMISRNFAECSCLYNYVLQRISENEADK